VTGIMRFSVHGIPNFDEFPAGFITYLISFYKIFIWNISRKISRKKI
jgi:hypothetical protein